MPKVSFCSYKKAETNMSPVLMKKMLQKFKKIQASAKKTKPKAYMKY